MQDQTLVKLFRDINKGLSKGAVEYRLQKEADGLLLGIQNCRAEFMTIIAWRCTSEGAVLRKSDMFSPAEYTPMDTGVEPDAFENIAVDLIKRAIDAQKQKEIEEESPNLR